MGGEMAQQVEALAAKPDDASSNPGTSVIEGNKQLPKVIF